MLDEKKVKEAETNVKSYLREGLLKKLEKADENILRIFRNNSEESLKVANLLMKEGTSHLWVIVCSYYSMFYIANAALYRIGYKVGHKIAHKVTEDALIVFVRSKLKGRLLEEYRDTLDDALEVAGVKADEVIGDYKRELSKRSKFQYDMSETAKRAKAETSLERAKKFAFELEKLL